VFRARCLALHTAVILATTAPAQAEGTSGPGALSEISVPGGLTAALAATDDHAAPDRSQFLLEFIRRTYDTPIFLKGDARAAALQALLAEMEQAAAAPNPSAPEPSVAPAPGSIGTRAATAAGDSAAAAPLDTIPLPLNPAIWIDVVFGGRATPQTLVTSILRSREASLFYYGLMSLDDDTRAWLAGQPELMHEIVLRRTGAFVAAAPGLRVEDGRVRVPGGTAAEAAWEALAGRPVRDPAGFVHALLTQNDGTLAWFFGALAQLSPAQIHVALAIESGVADRSAPKRLYAVFQRLAWNVEQRTFWRPSLDPALLLSAVASDRDGRPVLPGSRAFWVLVFAPDGARDRDSAAPVPGEPLDAAWLAEQIFTGPTDQRHRRYYQVVFASRRIRSIAPDAAGDAVTAVRAAGSYPALTASLERAGVDDMSVFAAAAARAAELSALHDDTKAIRALAQFQGTLAVLTRSAQRRTLSPGALASAVASVASLNLGKHDGYEGRLVQWLAAFAAANAPSEGHGGQPTTESARDAYDRGSIERVPGDLDRAVLRLVAGPVATPAHFVDWEGTRYRFDLATAEALRLAHLLGDTHRPSLESAHALTVIADSLDDPGLTRESLQQQLDALAAVANAAYLEGGSRAARPRAGEPAAYREAVARLRSAAAKGDRHGMPAVALSLRELADDLLGRGLMEIAYAAAMGAPERTPISVEEAASRHDFKADLEGHGYAGAWRLPIYGRRSGPQRTWHISGSLLGLDVTLADLSLLRLSSRPPSRRPTLNDEDRRIITEGVALVEPDAFDEQGRLLVLDTLRKGRARLASIRTDAEAKALAAEIGLGPARISLLPWIASHDPGRLAAFLSPVEILWLGLESRPVDRMLQAWGAPAGPRLGCLCVQLLDRRPWESFAGRWNLGVLASGFPDLNLRLVELLSDLQMPAPLLGPVLAAATIDFTENATSRDPDDRRGPVEFVQALKADRVEQYLALLTTDGPLFPVGDAADASQAAPAGKPGGTR
jgi:hypothetical protein